MKPEKQKPPKPETRRPPKVTPKPKPEPKPKQFWLVWWRAVGDEEWQVVRHFLGPLSDGAQRRFVGLAGAEACVDDLVAAGLEARAELMPPKV